MQRTDAVKWFWPFMLVAALAAATIIALPAFAPASPAAEQPQFRMLVTVSARAPHVSEATPVAIDPSCIRVTAKRPASFVHRLAGLFAPRSHES